MTSYTEQSNVICQNCVKDLFLAPIKTAKAKGLGNFLRLDNHQVNK